VRAIDAVTLAIELEAPTGYFLHLLTHHAARPIPRHILKAHGEEWTAVDKIVTNGPFKVASWQRGERLVLIRNETYHGRFGGNVETVEIVFLGDVWGTPDWGARTLALYQSGALDVVSFFGSGADRARQQHVEEHVSFPALWLAYVGFDLSQPPFSNLRVRRAFALAIDRERFVQEVWQGLFTPTTGGLIPPGMPGHSPGIGLAHDPARARALLAEAGYPEGQGFPSVRGVGGHPREVECLQAQWRETLGVEVDWQVLDLATAYQTLSRELPPLFWAAWIADYPDPDALLRLVFLRSYLNWRHDEYERLVEGARRHADQRVRMELYRQADRIVVEQLPLTPVMSLREYLLVKPWVRNYVMSLMGDVFWKDVVIEPH
jgi:oligopeptide transport system substrate-binding protein